MTRISQTLNRGYYRELIYPAVALGIAYWGEHQRSCGWTDFIGCSNAPLYNSGLLAIELTVIPLSAGA